MPMKKLLPLIVIVVITVVVFMNSGGQQKLLSASAKKLRFPGVEHYIKYATVQGGLKPQVGVVPLRPDFGDVINDVSGFRYPTHVPPCRESANSASVFVTIISAPGYFQKRESIRNSWIRDMLKMTDLIGYAFILGQTDNKEHQERIRRESEEFGDILQIDMRDDYYNLTMKVVGLLNWLDTNCHKASFILKVDDDVYVNVRNLNNVMKSLDPEKEGAYGLIKNRFIAHRGDYFTCRVL